MSIILSIHQWFIYIMDSNNFCLWTLPFATVIDFSAILWNQFDEFGLVSQKKKNLTIDNHNKRKEKRSSLPNTIFYDIFRFTRANAIAINTGIHVNILHLYRHRDSFFIALKFYEKKNSNSIALKFHDCRFDKIWFYHLHHSTAHTSKYFFLN